MFVNFFIRRPVFATVCSLLIILAGAVAIPSLPIAQFPTLAPPQVSLSAFYTGANAQADKLTCGGASVGNCAIGRLGMATAPAKIISSEHTVANTGRRMKKLTNMNVA